MTDKKAEALNLAIRYLDNYREALNGLYLTLTGDRLSDYELIYMIHAIADKLEARTRRT